jgi:hypothetical protein
MPNNPPNTVKVAATAAELPPDVAVKITKLYQEDLDQQVFLRFRPFKVV